MSSKRLPPWRNRTNPLYKKLSGYKQHRNARLCLEPLESRLCLSPVPLTATPVNIPVTNYSEAWDGSAGSIQVLAGETVTLQVVMDSNDPNESTEADSEHVIILANGSVIYDLNQWGYNDSHPRTLAFQASKDNTTFQAYESNKDTDENAVSVQAYEKPSGIPDQKSDIITDALVEGVAAVVLGLLSGGTGWIAYAGGALAVHAGYLSYTASDPPDPNYKQTDTPVTPNFPTFSAGAGVTQEMATNGNALFANLTTAIGLERVIVTAQNRWGGAYLANDTQWETYHLQIIQYYEAKLAPYLSAQPGLLQGIESAVRDAGINTNLSADQIEQAQQDAATNGLPADMQTAMNDLGSDAGTKSLLLDNFVCADQNSIAGDVMANLTSNTTADFLAAAAARFAGPNPIPARIGSAALAITHSEEFFADFVISAYDKYLGRGPDQSGLDYWVGLMQQGYVSDEHLEAGFIGSAEYIANHGGKGAGWVTGMYQNLLGRNPDTPGLNYWVGQLAAGADPASVAYGFAASAEREGQRIAADYLVYLGRPLDAAGQQYWVNQFLNGATNENVVAGFIASPEYYGNVDKGDSNWAEWIASIYTDTLHRQAVSTEIEAWIGYFES
jgi:Domain of unknown function (DUF4214)